MKTAIWTISTIYLIFVSSVFAYSGGSGDANNPYQIANIADFQQLSATPNDWNLSFILTTDINLTGLTFTQAPIAPNTDAGGDFQGIRFTGIFDGNSHIISNLTITASTQDFVGLFGSIGSGGQIRNLGVEDVNIIGHYSVGGLTAENNYGTLISCYASGSVTGDYGVGGLVGGNYYGSITSCHATGSFTGTAYIGGLVGDNNHGTLISCYASGLASGTGEYSSVGGLIGSNEYGTLVSCYADGSVNGTGEQCSSSAGGLVGYNEYGTLVSCYATGAVSGTFTAGGLMGYNYYGTLTSCFATGSVGGTAGCSVGGLVGWNSRGTLTACYATGLANGTGEYSSIGGLAGVNSGTITACYAIGLVSGIGEYSSVGGLVGYGYSNAMLTGCFWDTQSSGTSVGVGNVDPNPAGAIGKTTAEMQTPAAFSDAGWDFLGESANGLNDYWQMEVNDYPQLANHAWTLEGDGTFADPYVVANAADLGKVWLRPLAYYSLDGNLDLTGISWSSAVVLGFAGVFDGQRFIISHLTIDQPGVGNVALFGDVGLGGQIKNLGVVDVNITGGDSVGGLAGLSHGTLTNCYATGSVSGTGQVSRVGGLVGGTSGSVIGCYATCSVSSTGQNSAVGGLAGGGGPIIDSYASGSVSATGQDSAVGGLVGYNGGDTPTSCYAAGAVCGTGENSYVGGLVGYQSGTLTGCFWDTQTSGTNDGVGNVDPDPAGAIGKTSAEMQALTTFADAGWDFSDTDGDAADWMMLRPEKDYPRLAWQAIYPGDIAGLYGVDFIDYAGVAAHWGQAGCPTGCENADINTDGTVDINDLMFVMENWLAGI